MRSIKNYLFKGTFFFALTLLLLSFKDEKDSLHGRAFNTSMSETKNGIVKRKVIADHIYFKNGKLKSDFLRKKFGFKWIRYRINKDSMYVDSTGVDVRLLVVEASATDETNQTVMMNFTTLEWDIDGEIKITKNDRLRHKYALAGREKLGKPKKIKKRKSEEDESDPLFKIVMP
ncbi:hypothetical protein [Aurantibacillus circumpalustris]|uniref:hypothetical protein n=1 Tax=Aurantibacillus circumpalustris TaxID=3036359 RepID=UPI00295A89E9|nr:hypothetical protein [Aurantibacillus circumpalustris]